MRLKATLLTLLFTTLLSLASASDAERGRLTATIVDSELQTLPVAGAIVELSKQGDTTGSLYYSTDGDGVVAIPMIDFGSYTIAVSFLGYETKSIDFTINTPELELPTIHLTPSSVQMEAVVKEIKALRSSQSGDSLQYNANAYKVANDSDVEGLLQKMPGISIEDGKVSAQGETVTKIYIDGREFFGGDVATALKSLPAEVVDRIELFNKLSDEAEFTGMDDGSGNKTINIITKPEMREGIFGKLFGGVGYEPLPAEDASKVKYMGGGSVNIFKGKSRTSVIALVNNLNQQNFSFEDIMGATEEGSSTGEFSIKALPGVANVNAVGINYSNNFGKEERVKLQGSYFFNQTLTDNTEELTRWYEEPASTTIDSLYQTANTSTFNTNNRLTGRIDVKINDRQSLMIRPTLSYQVTEPLRSTFGTRFNDEPRWNYEDGMQHYSNSKSSYWRGYYIGTSALYRLRIGDSGRSLSAGLYASANNYDSEAETTTNPNEPNPNDAIATYMYETAPTNRRYISGSVTYYEPISERGRLTLSYKLGNTFQDSDKRTYDSDEEFIVADPNATKSTIFAESSYTTHNTGLGVKFYLGRKSSITASGYYQNSTFDVNTHRTKNGEGDPFETTKNYQDATYSVVAKTRINQGNTLRFYLTGNTTPPPIWKFADNTTNTTWVTAGNDNLEPSYNHRLRAYYTRTSIEKGSTLMFNCNATMSTKYIGTHIVLDPDMEGILGKEYDDVQQYTGNLNLDKAYYQLDSNISYGMPLDFAKCNLNFNAGVSYRSTPSLYGGRVVEMGVVEGGESVTTESMTYRGGLTLGSNISESVDFTLSWRGNYNTATNAYEAATTANTYFNQSASAYMKFTLLGGFTLTSNVAYKQYMGITNNYNDKYVLFNAFVGHKVMHKDRGEIIIGVNDILNQNMNLDRNVSSNYTQNRYNSLVGRYFSFQFIYNLRAFGLWGKK